MLSCIFSFGLANRSFVQLWGFGSRACKLFTIVEAVMPTVSATHLRWNFFLREYLLEADLRHVGSEDPVALLQTKGTPQVHIKPERLN